MLSVLHGQEDAITATLDWVTNMAAPHLDGRQAEQEEAKRPVPLRHQRLGRKRGPQQEDFMNNWYFYLNKNTSMH